jgi:hypothetical protein
MEKLEDIHRDRKSAFRYFMLLHESLDAQLPDSFHSNL